MGAPIVYRKEEQLEKEGVYLDKRLIANDMVAVYQSGNNKTVDARELHAFLEVGTRYNDWIKSRIEKYEFVEGVDYTTLTENLVNGGRQLRHTATLDMAKELCMVENNEQGRKVRRYFIEVEKRFRNGSIAPLAEPMPLERFQQIDRLIQMLKMGQRENLFTAETDRALRVQIAESLLGHSIPTLTENITGHEPKWVPAEGFSAKAIGQEAGCVASKVGTVAKKHNLQTLEYGDWYDYTSKGAVRQIFIYNAHGKETLLSLLTELQKSGQDTSRKGDT